MASVILDWFKGPAYLNQMAEFDACSELSKLWNSQPAIVDDDYPAWRHKYEAAARAFCAAWSVNRG